MDLMARAREDGMRSMLECALDLVSEGLTTLAEVERVIGEESSSAARSAATRAAAEAAARLAKADLTTLMVGEFPELQGVVGGIYLEAEGSPAEVATAVRWHYHPVAVEEEAAPAAAFAGRDGESRVFAAVALADKLDTLVGFWAIDEKPTGSKDPYALRRAALGVIRIVLDNKLRLPLRGDKTLRLGIGADLLAFFADRLKVHLRDEGARHDLIDAVFALGGQDDLLLVVRRVEALGRFLDTEDGANLLAGAKRAANILRIEEKKDGVAYSDRPFPNLLVQGEEKVLHRAIQAAQANARKAVGEEDFASAMRAIAKLRQPVDQFFDKVTVNADDKKLRENRLKLLSEIRAATSRVADFSKIAG